MIYVDSMCFTPMGKFRNMRMSHMIADNVEELHRFAAKIGLKRSWFQDKLSGPHYDISMSKRRLAIFHGAREITMRECAAICWCQRAGVHYSAPWRAEYLMKVHFLTELQGREDEQSSTPDEAQRGEETTARVRLTRRGPGNSDRVRLSNGKSRVASVPDAQNRVRLSRSKSKRDTTDRTRNGRPSTKKRHASD